MTHEPARVCVSTLRETPAVGTEGSESHDGVATPPRGRGLRPRRFRLPTTTNYILELVCSSRGRENNDKIRIARGGRRV